jgi:glyoxylase-like metal-dependent hydrolase (beta-lactamase superfamily II)
MMELDWRLIEAGHCTHPEASSRVGAPWRACEFPALVALLRHPREGWILFDTGYGQAFMDVTRHFPESLYRAVTPVTWQPHQSAVAQLARDGIGAESIAHVILSHFHGDHAGALPDFSQSTIWCANEAWTDLHARSRVSALAKGLLPALAPPDLARRLRFVDRQPLTRLPPELAPLAHGYDVFTDGSIYAVPLPGHAAGHFGIVFRARRQWVFLIADAAWSQRAVMENTPPPRWATGLLGDTAAYRKTLGALHALAQRRGDVLIVPAHCQSMRLMKVGA